MGNLHNRIQFGLTTRGGRFAAEDASDDLADDAVDGFVDDSFGGAVDGAVGGAVDDAVDVSAATHTPTGPTLNWFVWFKQFGAVAPIAEVCTAPATVT